MKPRYGVSPWVHELPSTRRPDLPQLRGERACDVVIVGGGLTGCATAYACAASGLKVIVLEGNRIGQGSAGRSAGLLLPEPGPGFREVAQAHGLRAARRIFEAWLKGASEGAALLRRLKLPRGVHPVSNLVLALPGDEKALQRELAAREQAGLDARWLKPAQAAKYTHVDAAALRLHDGFAVDPYRACLALASAASRRRARLFEHSSVRQVKPGAKHVEVHLEGAVVRAPRVVITTGIATAEFQPLRRHFKPRESYLVLTETVPPPMRRQLAGAALSVGDARQPRHRIRWTPDDRLLIAGADQDPPGGRTRESVLTQRTGQLMYELLLLYPAISGLKAQYGWEMPYGQTADGMMYIGPHRNYPRHLFALGGGGDSIAGAFVAARVLARAAREAAETGDEVFGWTR